MPTPRLLSDNEALDLFSATFTKVCLAPMSFQLTDTNTRYQHELEYLWMRSEKFSGKSYLSMLDDV